MRGQHYDGEAPRICCGLHDVLWGAAWKMGALRAVKAFAKINGAKNLTRGAREHWRVKTYLRLYLHRLKWVGRCGYDGSSCWGCRS